jgi:hypothetical protein
VATLSDNNEFAHGYGGQGEDDDVPAGWPQAPLSFWYRRHDEFDEPPPSARNDNVDHERP